MNSWLLILLDREGTYTVGTFHSKKAATTASEVYKKRAVLAIVVDLDEYVKEATGR